MKEKRREETPGKEKGLMKRNCNLIFSCCSFHETKAKKKNKERDKNKEPKESKKRMTRRNEETYAERKIKRE